MKKSLSSLAVLLLAGLISGCAHQLEVKNLNAYRNLSILPLEKPLTVGIVPQAGDVNARRVIKGVGTALNRYAATVRLPYAVNTALPVDVIASIAIHPEYKGSGWNFLINFPGFLVWAPAWHGYVYKADYDVRIALREPAEQAAFASWNIPVQLNIRHADINRTWTEISWFEVGIIAFVGGIVFIDYDDEVSPILAGEIERPLGDYIAQEIVLRLNQHLHATAGAGAAVKR
jgi:hypothetical protein